MTDILTSLNKRVLNITLNRPDKRNALTVAMCAEIVSQVRNGQTNPEVGSYLICANGSVFCAGMDLEETTPDGPERDQAHEQIFTVGGWSTKPIVTSVNGAALGGGLGLVAQGHVVIASENAVFGLPEVRIGLWPFFVYRSIEAAIGNRRTLQASLTGHLFHPEDAMRWGLVHKICPAVELADRSKVLARELAKASPVAISFGLQYVRESRGLSDEDAGHLAARLRSQVLEGADFQEGVEAFKQKREPRWPSMPPAFYEKS